MSQNADTPRVETRGGRIVGYYKKHSFGAYGRCCEKFDNARAGQLRRKRKTRKVATKLLLRYTDAYIGELRYKRSAQSFSQKKLQLIVDIFGAWRHREHQCNWECNWTWCPNYMGWEGNYPDLLTYNLSSAFTNFMLQSCNRVWCNFNHTTANYIHPPCNITI